ncbi:Ataxin-2 C-terminal protein [Dioscorea alata]|uniref:Ataxin-2 C-terminal protein n=1 Tax=Dioscorea alata TaxID=55571 RepID=A0ACB7VSJ4_DIOAL|nr:Ataxin-2 C-terminal protein [Dioscorea alata]
MAVVENLTGSSDHGLRARPSHGRDDRDVRELQELMSKLNPIAEEFVPPSLMAKSGAVDGGSHFDGGIGNGVGGRSERLVIPQGGRRLTIGLPKLRKALRFGRLYTFQTLITSEPSLRCQEWSNHLPEQCQILFFLQQKHWFVKEFSDIKIRVSDLVQHLECDELILQMFHHFLRTILVCHYLYSTIMVFNKNL